MKKTSYNIPDYGKLVNSINQQIYADLSEKQAQHLTKVGRDQRKGQGEKEKKRGKKTERKEERRKGIKEKYQHLSDL